MAADPAPSPFAILGDTLRVVIGKWSALTAIWSVLVYAVGYLALRFQLTAFGVGTDLSVLDERYLFEGAKFLLTVVLAIPTALLFSLPFACLIWFGGRVLPGARDVIVRWWLAPRRPLMFGIVFAVVLIQTVMAKCLLFNNLLTAPEIPSAYGFGWFGNLLVSGDDTVVNLYWAGLTIGIAVTAACALAVVAWVPAATIERMARGLLFVLLGIELLLLPVNYGYLSVRRGLPRLAGDTAAQTWLVWEGKEGVTYLLRDASGQRRMRTVAKGEVKSTEIVAYDPVLVIIHRGVTAR